MRVFWVVVVAGTIASLAPIWRGAGHSRQNGVSFWRLLYDSTQNLTELGPFGHPHILYGDAVTRAQQAYRDYCGGQSGNL